jgi:hypothetical protein
VSYRYDLSTRRQTLLNKEEVGVEEDDTFKEKERKLGRKYRSYEEQNTFQRKSFSWTMVFMLLAKISTPL